MTDTTVPRTWPCCEHCWTGVYAHDTEAESTDAHSVPCGSCQTDAPMLFGGPQGVTEPAGAHPIGKDHPRHTDGPHKFCGACCVYLSGVES
jgi:hypothetical protein